MKADIVANRMQIPKGYEVIAICKATDGLAMIGSMPDVEYASNTPIAVIRKIHCWRPAVIVDIDKGLQCRVKDYELANWQIERTLIGWRVNTPAGGYWLTKDEDLGLAHWHFCEVLDVSV